MRIRRNTFYSRRTKYYIVRNVRTWQQIRDQSLGCKRLYHTLFDAAVRNTRLVCGDVPFDLIRVCTKI